MRSARISSLVYTPNDIFLGFNVGNTTITTTTDREIGRRSRNTFSVLAVVLFILNICLQNNQRWRYHSET